MALFSLDKILGLASVGSIAADMVLLKKFLSSIAVIVALTAISGTMAGVLVIAAFYGLYMCLVHYGLEPRTAAIMVSGLAVLVTLGLAFAANLRWRQLRDIPSMMQPQSPLGRVGKVADAFLNGLLERSHQR